MMYDVSMIVGCTLCWLTLNGKYNDIISVTASMLYYIARYIMLLIFILRLYFIFKGTKFHKKPRYYIALITASSLAIVMAFFAIICYIILDLDPTIVFMLFGGYFTIDFIITIVTLYQFRCNLLALFSERQSSTIINIVIRYTILFFICFITTCIVLIILPINTLCNDNQILSVSLHHFFCKYGCIM